MQETSAPGAAVAGAWWERSLGVHDERAERYAAFARVLRFPESVPVRSIRVLSGICAEDPVAGRALAWVQNVPDATSLALEHMRLFGGFGVCGATDCLVTTPGTRKREREVVELVSASYRRFGYWTEDSTPHPLCPAHASNAFGFMAHCLLVGDLGVDGATREAEWFRDRFLREWMGRFAREVRLEARHPVTELVGAALEGFARAETGRETAGADAAAAL